jgi:hypothetical protein
MKKSPSGRLTLAHPLRIRRETLRRLEARDLQMAAAAFSGPSICPQTTVWCCVTR